MVNQWVQADELDAALDSDVAAEAASVASYLLWSFSGRRYAGSRTVTETYECPCTCWSQRLMSASITDVYWAGDSRLVNGPRNPCDHGCSRDRLRLRGTPVVRVSKVISGTEIITPEAYALAGRSVLQRLPGASWDPCGLTVSYTYGAQAPLTGRLAARKLANELAKAWSGRDDCTLPDRVTSVSRQGVSYTILDQQDFLQDLRTGIYEVDLFLKAANPDRARARARVLSPDRPRARRVPASSVVRNAPTPWDAVITPGEPAIWSVALSSLPNEILLDEDWDPFATIYTASGAELMQVATGRFTVSGDVLTIHLTTTETARLTGTETYDLYGTLRGTDYGTLVYVTSGNLSLRS